MKKLFIPSVFIPVICLCIITVQSACKKPCEEPDVDSLNAIYLEFDASGGLGSFTVSELESMYMVRYQQADFDSFIFPVDTLGLYDLGDASNGYKLRLSKDFPAGLPSGPPYYTDFMYTFESLGGDFRVRLQDIKLDGSYTEDCEYISREKSFVLNNDTVDVTGSTEYVLIQKD